jgi:hypothetical protein
MRVRNIVLILLAITGLTACKNQETIFESNEGIYRAPTQIPTQSSTVPSHQEIGSVEQSGEEDETPTPLCSNGLSFIRDVTIPDGTVVNPGELLDKRWDVHNSGSCNWDQRYRVKLIAGPGMGMPVQQALIPALSGTEVTIRMIFIAPEEPGNFRSAWQAYDPQDVPFGDPFFIDVVVAELVEGTEGE